MAEGGALGGPVSLFVVKHGGGKEVPEFDGNLVLDIDGPRLALA
jgi:hypothetical protein